MLSFKEFFEEETVSGDVRGLGYVTGDPSAPDTGVNQYVTTNQLASDKVNGALLKLMKDIHIKYHAENGFKTFNPMVRDKTLEYYDTDMNADPLLRDKLRNKGKNNNVTKG